MLRFTDLSEPKAPRLYPAETPRRGEIRVELRAALGEGVAGVRRAFAEAWQGWVRSIVIDHAGDPALTGWAS